MRLRIGHILLVTAALKASADVRLTAPVVPIEVETQPASGLNHAWVTDGADGLRAEVTSPGGATWYIFGATGAADATKIGEGTTIGLRAGSHGYIAEEGDDRTFFWVTDWRETPMTTGELSVASSDCSSAESSRWHRDRATALRHTLHAAR